MKIVDHLIPPIIALSLLTRLPIWPLLPCSLKNIEWTDKQQGLSVLWYPAVGLLLALLLTAFASFISFLPSLLAAALLLIVWVTLTGALHLDGFADAIDAAYASHRYSHHQDDSKEKILTVFKDPSSGAMAVVALILLLLFKFSLLVTLFELASNTLFFLLVTSLVVPRITAVIFMMTTPYAGDGLALSLKQHFPKESATILLCVIAILLFILLPLMQFTVLLASVSIITFLWRRFWLKAIDGFVGDCVGALIEIVEVVTLFILLLFLL